jgi:hypothetical protein
MERRPQSEEVHQPPWRETLLAPLRQQAALENEPPASRQEAAARSAGQPSTSEEAPAELSANSRRRRTMATTAIGQVLANVYHDPIRQTVTLLLDERHATAVIFAVRALAADYEAHAREIRAVAATLPTDSYGATNRQFIAIRHERTASRLRLVESNYRAEVSEGGRP